MSHIWNIFFQKKEIQVHRRRHPRAKNYNLVRCLPSRNSEREHLANLINLSESGLQLLSAFILHPGTILTMVINLGQENRQIEASTRVVWAKKIRHTEACRAGLEFVRIEDEDRCVIRDFVERCLRGMAV